ncbi:hypothetical protein CLOP_g4174, partial [Closterium sp. NIES-67]
MSSRNSIAHESSRSLLRQTDSGNPLLTKREADLGHDHPATARIIGYRQRQTKLQPLSRFVRGSARRWRKQKAPNKRGKRNQRGTYKRGGSTNPSLERERWRKRKR